MIKILERYLAPYLPMVFLCMAVLFGQAMTELYLPNLMSDIVNKGMVQGDTSMIYQTGAQMLLVTLVGTICAITASFLGAIGHVCRA